MPTAPNNNHASNYTYAVDDRLEVIALQTSDGLTEGEIYKIHNYNVNTSSARIYELDGTVVGWSSKRGTRWGVIKRRKRISFTQSSYITSRHRIKYNQGI